MDPFIVCVQSRDCLVLYQCSGFEMQLGSVSWWDEQLLSCCLPRRVGSYFLSAWSTARQRKISLLPPKQTVRLQIFISCLYWIPLDLAPHTNPHSPRGFVSFLASFGPVGTRHWVRELWRQGFHVGCAPGLSIDAHDCKCCLPLYCTLEQLSFVIALPAHEHLPHICSGKVFSPLFTGAGTAQPEESLSEILL